MYNHTARCGAGGSPLQGPAEAAAGSQSSQGKGYQAHDVGIFWPPEKETVRHSGKGPTPSGPVKRPERPHHLSRGNWLWLGMLGSSGAMCQDPLLPFVGFLVLERTVLAGENLLFTFRPSYCVDLHNSSPILQF